MFEIGRICVKTAGRDAGNYCVIVDILEGNYVLIDGNVRRRKCNIMHLEPTNKVIKIGKKASHDAVAAEFQKLSLDVWTTKARKTGERPRKQKGKKEETAEKKTEKKKKKAVKKEEKPAKKEEKPKTVKKAEKKTD